MGSYKLVPAILYKDELVKTLNAEIALNKEKYKYWINSSYYYFNKEISDSEWDSLSRVLINGNIIEGFFEANITEPEHYVNTISIMNFYDLKIFGKYVYQFIKELFIEYNFNKICFNVLSGNPIEKAYDKFVSKIGGRIVGVYKNHIQLYDATIVDDKRYEVLKEDFLKSKFYLDHK